MAAHWLERMLLPCLLIVHKWVAEILKCDKVSTSQGDILIGRHLDDLRIEEHFQNLKIFQVYKRAMLYRPYWSSSPMIMCHLSEQWRLLVRVDFPEQAKIQTYTSWPSFYLESFERVQLFRKRAPRT